MLDNQQIFKQIPKHIADWTQSDVSRWFQINDIEVGAKIKFNGSQFLNLTPTKLMNELKLSSFLTRKIADWIEFQTSDFDQYVDEVTKNSFHLSSGKQNQVKVETQKQSEELRWSDESLEAFKNVQMVSNRSNQQSESKQYKEKPTEKPLKFFSNQNQPSQNYQAFKYRPQKHSDKKKCNYEKDEVHLQSIKSEPFLNGKADFKGKLVLKDLLQNNSESRQDAETCNYIPYSSEHSEEKKRPLKKILSQNYLNDVNVMKVAQQSQYSNHVKFVSSQLMLGGYPVLTVFYDNNLVQISKNMRIGRNSSNDIILKTDGVSRNHAEIIVEEDSDNEGNRQTRYFIKDIGSKFGTFVEVDPQKPKRVFQNDCYSIGQTAIRIEKVKLYKSKQKFDLTISLLLTEEQQRSYTNKSFITVGNIRRESQSREPKNSQITKRCPSKQKRDIQLEDNETKNYHCRFTVINGEVYLEQVEGNILEKIEKNVKYQLIRNKYDVKFGDGDAVFKIQHVYRPVSYKSQ